MHPPHIIEDLAVILIAAGVMTLIFRAIRQPVVLGYLVAGFLVGPHFSWAPNILDTEGIKVWAEIGVIFLLFGLGLEFSFKKLIRVGAPASITALIEVAGMVGIGFLLGHAFGWTTFDSLFLGGILAISSTTIIIRALDELDMKTRGFVNLVFGVLIVEDLVAILLLVALSTIAVSRGFSGIELGLSALKLIFFLTLWFVVGIFLIPSFLKSIQRHLRQEMLLIVSLGLCFMMVVFATKAGFSAALGAFIMGSILAETLEGEQIAHLIQPIKDLFGAIFFVSVGMLIEPQILLQYAFPIAMISLVTILGKVFTSTTGALIAGQSLKHSVQSGMSLAQIGEFSFIIAGLGLSLNVTSDFLFPIAISVSAVTTFTTPYLIRSSDFVTKVLERFFPARKTAILEKRKAASPLNEKKVNPALKMLTNGVVVTAIFLIIAKFVTPYFALQGLNLQVLQSISLASAFLFSSPFLWAMVGGTQHFSLFNISRWICTFILCVSLTKQVIPSEIFIVLTCIVVLAIIAIFSYPFKTIYLKFENRFLHNLHENVVHTHRTAQLVEQRISPDSPLIGNTLSGVETGRVVAIEKGGLRQLNPEPEVIIELGDVLWIIAETQV